MKRGDIQSALVPGGHQQRGNCKDLSVNGARRGEMSMFCRTRVGDSMQSLPRHTLRRRRLLCPDFVLGH